MVKNMVKKHLLVVLLAGGIPEGELDLLAVHLDVGHVVFKHGGDVDLCVRWGGDLARAASEWATTRTSGNMPLEKTMRLGSVWGKIGGQSRRRRLARSGGCCAADTHRHVLPHAPSPGGVSMGHGGEEEGVKRQKTAPTATQETTRPHGAVDGSSGSDEGTRTDNDELAPDIARGHGERVAVGGGAGAGRAERGAGRVDQPEKRAETTAKRVGEERERIKEEQAMTWWHSLPPCVSLPGCAPTVTPALPW